MKRLLTILFFLMCYAADAQLNLIGYIQDGGSVFPSSTGCSLSNINTAVFASFQFGQLPAGGTLYLDAAGINPVIGNSHWFGFTKTFNGSSVRSVQIDATGHIVNSYVGCGSPAYPTVIGYKSTTATSNCANINFTDQLFAAADEALPFYNNEPVYTLNGGAFLSNGSYTFSYKLNGPAVWKLDVSGSTSRISNITYCQTTPVAEVGGDLDVYLPSPTINLDALYAFDPDGTVSISWTKIAGPNNPVINNPSTAHANVTGVIAGTYTFRCTVTDNNSNTSFDEMNVVVHPVPRCQTPYKLDIPDSVIYLNLTGYIASISPLFDGSEDPLNGINGTSSTGGNATLPVPVTGEKFSDYYERDKGWTYDLWLPQEFYVYQISMFTKGTGQDTVDVYMGDSLFNDHPASFTRLRNINSQVPTFTVYNTPNVFEWKNTRVDDSTSHIRIRIKNAWFAGNPLPDGGISNFIVYGCRIGSVPPIYGLTKKPIPLKEKNGTNIATQINPIATNFKKQKAIRTYPQKNWVDDQNIIYPNNAYNADFFTSNPYFPYNDSIKNKMGIFFWPAMLGTSQWMMDTYGVGMGYAAFDGINVDPEDPSSYTRLSDMMWNYSVMFGNPPGPVDTVHSRQHNYAHLSGGRKIWAFNVVSGIEDDNERSGWFQLKKLSPKGAVAQASAVKDGDQGRIHDQWGGNRMGIKNADPNLKFVMSGTVGVDSEEVKARIYLSLMLRGEVMWDIIQVHQYWSRFDDAIATATTNGQINNWGTYPEDDSARWQYDNVVKWGNRIAHDTLSYITGEHGNDGVFYYPHDASEVSATRTQYGSPQFIEVGAVALDSLQAQAVAIEQGYISIARSNLVLGVQYLFHDLTPPTDLPGYLNSYVSSGYVFHSTAKKPSWYRMISQENIMGEYYLDETLSEVNGGLIHYRGHRWDNYDSVINVYYTAKLNSGSGTLMNINVHNATSAKEWTSSYNNELGTGVNKTVASNQVATTATITPRYLITYEANSPPIANAGADQTILLPLNFVTLDGSSSSDPDGTITSYSWTKISGPSTFNIVSPSSAITLVNNLVEGIYVFQLTVTDNASLTNTDTVTITVNNNGSLRMGKRWILVNGN